MQFVSWFVLFVLLSNGYPNGVISADIKSKESTDFSNKTKIDFDDLIEDVQYIIMELLITEDVMHLMEAVPTLSTLGVSIYQKRYRGFEIFVSDAYMMCFIKNNFAENHDVNPPQLNFISFDVVFGVIKHFGSVIQRIRFDRRVLTADESGRKFSQLINKYASDSLTHLNLGEIEPATFLHFTTPFKSVEYLSFIVKFYYEIDQFNKIAPLNQIFPILRQLKMKLGADVDYSFIDCDFAHLEHLKLIIGLDSWKRKDQIKSLLSKNSRIQSLDGGLFVWQAIGSEYIKAIQKSLPNIQNLSLSEFQFQESIQFNEVKEFCLKMPKNIYEFSKNIGNLSFPHLDKLKIIVKNEYFIRIVDTWDEFFDRHLNISKLHYINHVHDCNEMMEHGESSLPNLIELTLECTYDTDPEGIHAFLQSHDKLMKFQMIKRIPLYAKRLVDSDTYRDLDDLNALRRMLEQEWIVEDLEGNGYSFERKLTNQ